MSRFGCANAVPALALLLSVLPGSADARSLLTDPPLALDRPITDAPLPRTLDTRLRLAIPPVRKIESAPDEFADSPGAEALSLPPVGSLAFVPVVPKSAPWWAMPIAVDALIPPLAGPAADLEGSPDLLALSPGTAGPDAVRVRFGRDTTLADGGFDALPSIDEAGGSYFNGGQRFDRYNLDLQWSPTGTDTQVQWLVLGGIEAVRADITGNSRLGITDARGTAMIPTIGTGLRWQPSDAVVFSTTASTQSLDTGGGVVDISFSAEFRLSPLVGLAAGYEFYESSMTVENLQTRLDREGVFAKLTIRF